MILVAEKIYIGGNKFEIEIDVDHFRLDGFEKAIRDILGIGISKRCILEYLVLVYVTPTL